MPEPQNNFLVFNETNNPDLTMSDSDYASDLYRINGLIPMIADPIAHNKMYRQWSIMAKAVADMICDKGYNALDTDVIDLKNNLKTSVKGLARDELQSDINSKADIDHTHTLADITDVETTANELNVLHGLTATAEELNTLDGITSTTEELNILDGVTASAGEINKLDGLLSTTEELNCCIGAKSNIQQQINNISISSFIPLRIDNTNYSVGTPIKIPICTPFQYLEALNFGTCGSGLNNRTTPLEVGEVIEDGGIIWFVCDMRDSRLVGEIIEHVFCDYYQNSSATARNFIKGYMPFTDMSQKFFDIYHSGESNYTTYYPEEAIVTIPESWGEIYNYQYIRLIPLILNQMLYKWKASTFAYSLFYISAQVSDLTQFVDDPTEIDEQAFRFLLAIGIVNWWRKNPLNFLTTTPDDTVLDDLDIDYFLAKNPMTTNQSLDLYNTKAWVILQIQKFYTILITTTIDEGYNNVQFFFGGMNNLFFKNGTCSFNDGYTIGDLESEGLPNITGVLGWLTSTGMSLEQRTNELNNNESIRWKMASNNYEKMTTNTGNTSFYGCYDIDFNASRSNAIYGRSNHVTPKNMSVARYIKL